MSEHGVENTPAATHGFILLPGEGRLFQLQAGPFTIKAHGQDTGGSVAVWEDTVLPSVGPPLHIHHRCDELFYVLEGEFLFKVGDQLREAPAGSFIFIPKGAPHTYQNKGTTTGKLLGFVVPSGLEEFLEEQAKVPPGQMTPGVYAEIALRHDMDIIGPPLGG